MTDLPGFDIRYTASTDVSYLKKWLEEPGMLHWFPMDAEKEVEDALQCWIGFSRYNCSLTATLHDVPCAIGTLFLMPYRKVAHHCMFKLIVAPEHQRQGMGGSLIKNLKHLAKQYFRLERIHIEIFEGNPLLSLLEKHGFHVVFRQERYIKEGGEYRARILLESILT